MLELPYEIAVFRGQELTRLRVSELTPVVAGERIDNAWWLDFSSGDSLWTWQRIVANAVRITGKSARFPSEAVSLLDDARTVHAAMVYNESALSILDPGSGAVIIEYLATAPWNRASLTVHPIYSGCGTALVLFAVAASYFLGFGGRLTCCPLPNSEVFFTKLGFVRTDRTNSDDFAIYEIPSANAIDWLTNEGIIT